MNLEDLNQELQVLREEVNSWQLSEENYLRFHFLMKSLYEVRVEISNELIYNRDFCHICATKILVQKTIDGQPVIDFLSKIEKLPNDIGSFVYEIKEFLFLMYILCMMERTGPMYLIEHLSDYITLRYPQIKTDADKEKILNLRIPSLGINSMLSELLTKILDFLFIYVHNMKLTKDVTQRVTTFLLERIFGSFRSFTIIYFESTNVWQISFNKFATIYEGLDLCDPLTITKEAIPF